MRYENPLYMVEDAGAADLISGGRLQLGISRGSPEQVIEGWRHFGYEPKEERKLAIAAAKAMGLDVAGVDLIRSAKGPFLLEVNSSPGLEGIEGATGKDVALEIIRAIENNVAKRYVKKNRVR